MRPSTSLRHHQVLHQQQMPGRTREFIAEGSVHDCGPGLNMLMPHIFIAEGNSHDCSPGLNMLMPHMIVSHGLNIIIHIVAAC